MSMLKQTNITENMTNHQKLACEVLVDNKTNELSIQPGKRIEFSLPLIQVIQMTLFSIQQIRSALM